MTNTHVTPYAAEDALQLPSFYQTTIKSFKDREHRWEVWIAQALEQLVIMMIITCRITQNLKAVNNCVCGLKVRFADNNNTKQY